MKGLISRAELNGFIQESKQSLGDFLGRLKAEKNEDSQYLQSAVNGLREDLNAKLSERFAEVTDNSILTFQEAQKELDRFLNDRETYREIMAEDDFRYMENQLKVEQGPILNPISRKSLETIKERVRSQLESYNHYQQNGQYGSVDTKLTTPRSFRSDLDNLKKLSSSYLSDYYRENVLEFSGEEEYLSEEEARKELERLVEAQEYNTVFAIEKSNLEQVERFYTQRLRDYLKERSVKEREGAENPSSFQIDRNTYKDLASALIQGYVSKPEILIEYGIEISQESRMYAEDKISLKDAEARLLKILESFDFAFESQVDLEYKPEANQKYTENHDGKRIDTISENTNFRTLPESYFQAMQEYVIERASRQLRSSILDPREFETEKKHQTDFMNTLLEKYSLGDRSYFQELGLKLDVHNLNFISEPDAVRALEISIENMREGLTFGISEENLNIIEQVTKDILRRELEHLNEYGPDQRNEMEIFGANSNNFRELSNKLLSIYFNNPEQLVEYGVKLIPNYLENRQEFLTRENASQVLEQLAIDFEWYVETWAKSKNDKVIDTQIKVEHEIKEEKSEGLSMQYSKRDFAALMRMCTAQVSNYCVNYWGNNYPEGRKTDKQIILNDLVRAMGQSYDSQDILNEFRRAEDAKIEGNMSIEEAYCIIELMVETGFKEAEKLTENREIKNTQTIELGKEMKDIHKEEMQADSEIPADIVSAIRDFDVSKIKSELGRENQTVSEIRQEMLERVMNNDYEYIDQLNELGLRFTIRKLEYLPLSDALKELGIIIEESREIAPETTQDNIETGRNIENSGHRSDQIIESQTTKEEIEETSNPYSYGATRSWGVQENGPEVYNLRADDTEREIEDGQEDDELERRGYSLI